MMNLMSIDEDILIEEDVANTDQTIEEEIILDEPDMKSTAVGAEDWIEDSSVPEGWNYKYVKNNVIVRDSSGKRFNGRRNAILHVMKTKKDLQNIEVLDIGLAKEGWSSNPCLPSGWKHKRNKNKTNRYMTDSYEVLESHSNALQFVKKNLDGTSFARLDQWIQNQSKSISSERTAPKPAINETEGIASDEGFEMEETAPIAASRSEVAEVTELTEVTGVTDVKDVTVPSGWRCEYLPSAGMSLLTSPEGRQFSSRQAALRQMVEAGAPIQEVEEMRQFLRYEEWEEDQLLPPGWRIQHSSGDTRLLTEQGEVLGSFTEAISHLRDHPALYGQDYQVRLDSLSLRLGDQETPTVPPGWTVRVVEKISYITAPDGSVFRSRRSALENMIVSGKYNRADVEEMRTFLKFEDWTESSDLPAGWRMKRRSKSVILMGNDGKLFESIIEATEFVNRYSLYFHQEDVDKIMRMNFQGKHGSSQTTRSDYEDSKTNPTYKRRTFVPDDSWSSDDTVPKGWLQKTDSFGDNRTFQWLLSPEGEKFKGRRSVLEHMIKNNFPQESITEIRGLLKHEGWNTHKDLPKYWMYKPSVTNISFCSPEGKRFSSKGKAMRHLKSTGSDTDLEILRTFSVKSEEYVDTNIKPEITEKRKFVPDDSWTSDETVLKGWMQKTEKIGNDRTFQCFLSPDGQRFKGKWSVLKHMIQNNFPEESITEVRNMIKLDGWNTHQNLPKDWMYKLSQKHTYIRSPEGLFFKSKEKAMAHLKSTGSDTDLEILKIFSVKSRESEDTKIKSKKEISNFVPDDSWTSDDKVLKGWMQKTVEIGKNRVFQMFLSPDGQRFKGKWSVLKHMIQNNFPEESINEVRNMIKLDGWNTHQNLPKDWMYKPSQKNNYIRSPEGLFFKSKEKAMEHLKSTGRDADLEILRKFSGKFEGSPDDSWSSDDKVPEGWKQKMINLGRSKTIQMFLSPDGQKFKGKRAVIKHMTKENYPSDIVGQMRSLLKSDEWKFHQNLPTNWMYKISGNKTLFCSPSGESLASRTEAARVAEKEGRQEDVEKLKSFPVEKLNKGISDGLEMLKSLSGISIVQKRARKSMDVSDTEATLDETAGDFSDATNGSYDEIVLD